MVNPRANIKYDIPKEWVENFKKGCCPVCAKTKFEFDKGMKVYCSKKCRELYSERIYTQERRDKVLKERGAKCEKCKRTQKQLSKYKEDYKEEQKKKHIEEHPELLEQRRKELMEEAEEKYQKALNLKAEDLYIYGEEIKELPWSYDSFEVDHIKAVALGGDMFDEKNLQVLCYPCHKGKTSEDAKKIALLRKKEKMNKKGQKELEKCVKPKQSESEGEK